MPFPNNSGKLHPDGKFGKIRALYRKSRTPARLEELEVLCRDVDYLVAELIDLERRTGQCNLVSGSLRKLQVQLRYWEERHKFKSDSKQIDHIAAELDYSHMTVVMQIFDKYLLNTKWINLEDGGHEWD